VTTLAEWEERFAAFAASRDGDSAHDGVFVPKDSPERSRASVRSAEAAGAFLRENSYPERWIPAIEHAIAAHSFSAGIAPETIEAKVVQDADRLEALGAVGIARCLTVGGALNRPLCDPDDPFCQRRPPDDSRYSADHFFVKLLRLTDTMHTGTARAEARRRTAFLKQYLHELAREMDTEPPFPVEVNG
jgi:uncharacterized protein